MTGMGVRFPTKRVLVGLSVMVLLAGCASNATPSLPAATPTPASVPSAVVATPNVTASPTLLPTASATHIPTVGQPADDGARIVRVTTVDARTRDLTIQSPALGSPFGVALVRLLLPAQFDAQPAARWPVLYLLCGAYLGEHTDWTQNTDVETLTAPTDLLVVMPDAVGVAGEGWYSDWWNGGAGGPPKWETFHLVELRQLLERNWHAGDKRVIAGLSMGGYGAMEYASRQPGMFLAAASFSGPLDPLGAAFEGPNDRWGDLVAQADVWKAHDPTDNAAALKGTALYVAYGNGEIGPLDNGVPSPYDPDGSTERDVAVESATFVHQLGALHIAVTVDAYGNGTHNWPYCARDLHRWLPLALKALGEKP
jgi:S-formylglutathione hydrolase FrmB